MSYFVDGAIWDPSWWFSWCEASYSLIYCCVSKNYQIFHQNFDHKIWRFTFSGCADGRNFWVVLFFQSSYIQDVLKQSRLFLSLKLVEICHDILNSTLTESYFKLSKHFGRGSPHRHFVAFFRKKRLDIYFFFQISAVICTEYS